MFESMGAKQVRDVHNKQQWDVNHLRARGENFLLFWVNGKKEKKTVAPYIYLKHTAAAAGRN